MPHLRQTYLGASPLQTLCIMPCSHEPTGECFLHQMPDEILRHILEYLAPAQSLHGRSGYEPCLPIPLVCRRWERIYYSILYRNIDLGFRGWIKKRRIRRLETTLRQRPDLSAAVRMVWIQLCQPSDATCEIIAYILGCCTGLRKFGLSTSFTKSTCTILHAARRPQLATLELSGFKAGPSLQMILKHFSLPTLKEVSLARYELGSGDESRAPWYSSSDTAHEDLSLLDSSASPCNVTTVRLLVPNAPVHATRSFLQWPARLTSLTIKFLDHSACGRAEYTINAVQGILDDHRHTLRRINLGFLARGTEHLPDFSSFTSLESLQLHAYDLFWSSPSRAVGRLNAPRLRHLGISFDREDGHDTSPLDFGPYGMTWFEDFVGQITRMTNRFETVFVQFDPEVSLSDIEYMDYIWPWYYVDQTVGLFAAQKVVMTYSQHRCSRKKWDQMVEQRKQMDGEQAKHGSIKAYFTSLYTYPSTNFWQR